MKLFTAKNPSATQRKIVADDMILTKDFPTTAGSKMLDGYMSLFDAQALTNLYNAGYSLAGKADVGEFAIDLVGETSYNGAIVKDGKLCSAVAEIILDGEAEAGLSLDVNGAPRRSASQTGLVALKPTYAVVSRFGLIPVACSGDCLSIMSKKADTCKEIFDVITGHDDKDGTSLPEEKCALAKQSAPIKRVAIIKDLTKGIDNETAEKLNAFKNALTETGVEVIEIESSVIAKSNIAWNILMSAELCNNVSRYDGVKYGYRAKSFSGIDELYTNSRTEAFGKLLKSVILYGSDTLSTENYKKVYDKALRTRRVIVEEFAKIFEQFDAVITPATSKTAYTEQDVKENEYAVFEENFYTAPASITGLPAVVSGGVQVIGKAFYDTALLELVKSIDKEAK